MVLRIKGSLSDRGLKFASFIEVAGSDGRLFLSDHISVIISIRLLGRAIVKIPTCVSRFDIVGL